MLHFIDVSNWQEGINLPSLFSQIDGVVCKATEGTGYVDPTCDGYIQHAIKCGKLWGFYHFAGNSNATKEADYFYGNTKNYFGYGVPVLDWEGNQNVSWVNAFVSRIHELTGIWPWIYANPWRFKQGGVESNCMRWVASYPSSLHPTFSQAEGWDTPSCDGLVGAWQFCSDGRLSGYSGNLDCDLFYGDKEAWLKYAGYNTSSDSEPGGAGGNSDDMSDTQTLENEIYRITVEKK